MLRKEHKVLGGLALAIASMSAIGFVFYLGISLLIADSDRVSQTHTIINTLTDFFTQIQDVQISARGYVMSGEEQHLHQKAASETRAADDLSYLRRLFSYTATPIHDLDILEALCKSRLESNDQLVQTCRERGLIAAIGVLRTQLEENRVDLLHQQVSQMILAQREHLSRRAFNSRSSSRAMLLIVAGGTVGEVLIAVAAFLAIRKYMRECDCAMRALEQAKARVEEQASIVATKSHQLDIARRVADDANTAKSTFLANMSHEIRTPVTAILGYADLVLEPQQTSSDRHDSLQVIRRSARHLLDLINDILDLSKIEAGKLTVEAVPCNIAHLISEVVSMIRPRAQEKHIALRLNFDGAIPDNIRTDPLRLRQILMNLLGNAVKFTLEGEVCVTVRCQRDSENDNAGQLQIALRDSGIGMTPDQLARIFRPFTQADETTTRRFGGTGLGLTISKHLAEMLGGDITVASEFSKGSKFLVSIATGDLSDAHWIHGLTETSYADTCDPSAGKDATLTGRILLADDGADNQRLITHHLRRAGAEVIIADNGKIAVELVRAQSFDLVLMDMQMPELDGYSAAREIRRLGYTLPIIALTAHAMAGDRDKCLAAGCSDYLTKPVDKHQLLWTIAGHLKTAAVAPLPPPAPAPPPACGETIYSEFANDAQMRDVVDEFIGELPRHVADLEAFLEDRNLADLRRIVHQLKGVGGGYGLAPITTVAARAEQSLKNQDSIGDISQCVEALVELIRRVDGYKVELETPCRKKS